jgi:regulator of protease activity HflC (stomatin/prohibitin superfamily)
MTKNELIIKDTHRGLWYEDGVLTRVLEAGRYKIPRAWKFLWMRRPKVEIILVDVRERELTIKGQEILTSDKVAIRVSIIVQFRVIDPKAAMHEVENYEERIYGDVQLAARRSLALMTLDLILTNRNQLSEDILREVKEVAKRYGVEIQRADVKDLTFPGNLQEVMNKVLAAERMSQVQLVEARTKAEAQQIESDAKITAQAKEYEAFALGQRTAAETEAAVMKIKTAAELLALRDRVDAAQAYTSHPALLRLRELETLNELGRSGNARLYVDFDRRLVDD